MKDEESIIGIQTILQNRGLYEESPKKPRWFNDIRVILSALSLSTKQCKSALIVDFVEYYMESSDEKWAEAITIIE